MAGGQLDHLWFISMDMAPSHKIYEQNCFNIVIAFVNIQHRWKQRIQKQKYLLYLRINKHERIKFFIFFKEKDIHFCQALTVIWVQKL